MSLIKSVVFLAVVALAAGTVHKALPRKNIRADPRINVREGMNLSILRVFKQ